MDEGNVHYFGPWNENAQKLLSKYLPVSHLLAAAGGAEQPRDDKPKAKKAPDAKKDTKKEDDKVGQQFILSSPGETSWYCVLYLEAIPAPVVSVGYCLIKIWPIFAGQYRKTSQCQPHPQECHLGVLLGSSVDHFHLLLVLLPGCPDIPSGKTSVYGYDQFGPQTMLISPHLA